MECPICIEEIKENQDFKCFSCNGTYCLDCMKTYLIGCNEDPHCLNCRAAISYDQFVNKFDMKWRLGNYKKHKEKILLDKELALMPVTVGYLERLNNIEKLKDEKAKLAQKMYEIDIQIHNLLGNVKKETVVKYEWTQACPLEGCRGYLNASHECAVCNKTFCKSCLEEKKTDHECDEALVETMKLIKKESKPCPKCSEFISKISGCDQMFCTNCGTAFSWKTGNIEKGIIHNPHAHQFFQNNPDAYNMYMQNRNQPNGNVVGNGNNPCRDLVPRTMDFHKLSFGQTIEAQIKQRIMDYRRHVAEFNQYREGQIERELASIDNNQDLRLKFIKKEIDEKHFKVTLHMRNKKHLFRQQVHEVIVSTKIIFGNMLWNLMETQNKEDFMKIYNMFMDLKNSTNEILLRISQEHNYKSRVEFSNNLYFPQY